jgi:hypothetical protein
VQGTRTFERSFSATVPAGAPAMAATSKNAKIIRKKGNFSSKI